MEKPSSELVAQIQAAASPETPTPEEREVLIRELQDFTKQVEHIDRTYKAGAMESWISPHGREGRTWSQELDHAVAHRHEGYVPQMTYPALERSYHEENDRDGTKLDTTAGLQELEQLEVDVAEKYKHISPVALVLIYHKKREFRFLEAVKSGDSKGVIANMPFGRPSDELVKFANAAYEADLRPKPKKNETAEKLSGNTFNSRDLKEYFEYAIQLLGAKEWRVEISTKQQVITVYPENKKVGIPPRRKVDGIELLKLTAHEIGAHVGTTYTAESNGFGTTSLGKDASILQEGLAMLAEREIEQLILGYPENPGPYYVLGIQQALENGGDFWKTYDYLIDLRKKELIAQGRSEKYIDKNLQAVPRRVLARIFRGSVDLSHGGYVYTKDKAYLEGEMIAEKIKEVGLLGFMLAGKYDIPTAIFLLQNRVIPKDAVNLTIDVAHKIWANQGDKDFLVNLNWYRENHNDPYWREFGVTYEEYIQAMISGIPIKSRYSP